MARIRNVKPEFFRHEELQDLEIANQGKYPMFVYEALWGHCDRHGVFQWKPKTLKLDILPFLPFDMEETMNILLEAGFIMKYTADGREYGFVPTFTKHQAISNKENDNKNIYPAPPAGLEKEAKPPDSFETVPEQFRDGSGTVSEQFRDGSKPVPEQVWNTGVRSTDNGVRSTENGKRSTDSAADAPGECDLTDPKQVFLHIWQTTPGNIFNSFAAIEKPKDWARFWSASPPTCEEVRRILQNVIDDVNAGALERRFIAKTPDRFVLGGGFTRHQTRFQETKKTSPPPGLAGKKSLGGLEK